MKAKKFNPYDVILDDEEKEIEKMIAFKKAERPKQVKAKIAILKEVASKHLRKRKKVRRSENSTKQLP